MRINTAEKVYIYTNILFRRIIYWGENAKDWFADIGGELLFSYL